jgi:adenosylhomocysteine nucleosidase
LRGLKRSLSFSNFDLKYDVGIITAVKSEFEAIYDRMKQYGDIRVFTNDEGTKAEKKFFCGKIKGQNCVLSMSGVGTEDAAICTERMINDYKVDRILNVGSAGTNVESKVKVGDCVISSQCVRFDVDLTILPEHRKGSYEKGADPFIKANQTLVDLACAAGDESRVPYHVGTVVTGNSFINDPTEKRKILEEFDALCDEMEGASIAKYCANRGISFVVIRCISDKPIKKENVMYYEHFENASKRCAVIVESFCGLLTKEKNKDIFEKLKEDLGKIQTQKFNAFEM